MKYSKLVVFGLVVFSIFAFVNAPVFAETTAKSTNFEKTTLIEFTNNDSTEVKTVRIWLGADAGSFKSFKTEKGWTGVKTPQGVLVFTTEDPLTQGESVKFGIKTEIENPGVNWKSLDSNGNEMTIGKVVAGQVPPVRDDSPPPPPTDKKPAASFESAVFRIIPDKPKNGDSVRIVGEGFPPNTSLDFLIDGEKLEDFLTDGSGRLIGRAKIPVNKEADRVEFSLVDDSGNKKTVSIRIEYKETQIVSTKAKRLTVDQMVEIVEPGQVASASGTGKPGTAVTITAQDSSGNKIYEEVATVDSQGNWSHETTIPPSAAIGTRKVTFSDGIDSIEKTLSISISKTIQVKSSMIKYNPGEKMFFNGTGVANQPLEIIINDPIGKEVFFDVMNLGESGAITFEYQTEATAIKGTYTILFTQGDETAILRVGLGESPSEQIVAKFDKLNYSTLEKAKLTLQGPANANLALSVIDPSDKEKLKETVTLGPDGRKEYEITLTDYKTGVYSVVLQYQKYEIDAVFTVGLQFGSGEIKVQATKQTYQSGESIVVLGSTSPNTLLNLAMIDPDGNIFRDKDLFTDKSGTFFEGTFRIPSNAKQGTWTIKASSGANYAETKITISGTVEDSFAIKTDKTTAYNGGEIMTISGTGGGRSQTTIIKILDPANTEIQELILSSTDAGTFQTIWAVPLGLEPGTYKIKVTLGSKMAEISFSVQ
ncbi:MAG: biofilm-associated protein [Candidatus Nitrosotenuis sp.]